MLYKFLCQNCLSYIESNDWDYYHLTDGSCPQCGGDMCGCPECVSFINDKYGLED